MKRAAIFLILALLLLLAVSTLAMESDNFQLNWFTPLTGDGGAASSTNYAVNLTVGQTAAQVSSSANYGACLGYWCEAVEVEHTIYFPLVRRDSP